jgi:hypothetical protein
VSPASDPRHTFARVLSILGHPALLMPLAVVGSAAARGAPAPMLQAAAIASGAVAVGVGIYSVRQVRAGRWQHIDASQPRERGQLNLFLVLLLSGMAALLVWTGQPRLLAQGLGIGAVVVAVAQLARQWLKVSLHAAFGAFAVGLAWPGVFAVAGLALLAAGVAWSRLVLRRHTRAEVWAGLALGAIAGLIFQGLAA